MSEYLCWNRKLRIIRYPGDIINLSMDTNKNNHHIMKEDIQQYRVNETAVEIMRLVNGKNTYDDIVAALCDKYKEEEASVALIAHYNYTEYVEKFNEIYGMLSKEAVITGEFEKKFALLLGPYRREPFDEYFLKQIKEWRLVFGNSIMKNNPSININTLNIVVQRILNRIIFLRICEDRSFEDYETLKHVMNDNK